MSSVTRRDFVSSLAAGATVASPLLSSFGDDSDQEAFSFLLLGDTHFDRPEHHDFDWMRRHFAKDITQVESYCRHTETELPKLLAAAKRQFGRSTTTRAFVLHVGDLIEGICGNRELAERHCREGWEFFKAAGFEAPLLMTKGNHDVTGPGAAEAYGRILMPAIAAELGRTELERTSYAFRRGDCLFAAFDSYDRTAIDWLEELTATEDFRQLFVLTHMPIVPYNARSTWRVYSRPEQSKLRQRLIDLLGRRQAIVLCGHLHKYCLLTRRTDAGRFTQLAISSIFKGQSQDRPPLLQGSAEYGPQLTDLEPTFDPDTLSLRQDTLRREQPHIERFEYARESGYAVVHVDGPSVTADVYRRPDENVWRTVDLSPSA